MFFKKDKKKQPNENLSEGKQDCEKIKHAICALLAIKKTDLVQVQHSNNQIKIKLPLPYKTAHSEIIDNLVSNGLVASTNDVEIESNIPIFHTLKPIITNVKNIIAVSSGKGGVGKSATAINLALALKQLGARVGVLDADIYGPSVPIMLGTQNASPKSPDNKTMYPIEALGLVSNSIGYLVKNDHASIWRGPMASKALQQLLNETKWPLLDYLIVDMPPGTGDIQLTMAQQLPLTGAVIVTTPQDIAVADAAKGIAMFEKLEIPILGLVENMSSFVCPHCEKETPIFDLGGGRKLAERYKYPILAELPLNPKIRECTDQGKSIFTLYPEDPLCQHYLDAAANLSINLVNQVELASLVQNDPNGIAVTQLS